MDAAPPIRGRPCRHGRLVPRQPTLVRTGTQRRVSRLLRAPVRRGTAARRRRKSHGAQMTTTTENKADAELRGVVLAGGTGSRLFPLTKVTNKHLLPVGREPMIFHPVRKLVEAKVREILIVTGTDHMGDVVGLLGSGKEFGCEFTYRVQDEAGGIAQALGLARRFGRGGRLAVILGDNIFGASIAPFAEAYRPQP